MEHLCLNSHISWPHGRAWIIFFLVKKALKDNGIVSVPNGKKHAGMLPQVTH